MDSDNESLGEFQRQARQISAGRIADSTKKNYTSKLKKWQKWMKSYKPENLDQQGELIVPIDHETILAFLGSIIYIDQAKTKMRANSTIMGYYSALKYYYSEKKVTFNSSEELNNFLSGYQKETARARENGELPSFEGKQFISFLTFRKIAHYALKNNGSDSNFTHLYLVLCWNLMGRSNTTAHLNMSNIKWENDSLVIDIPRHKGDQTGEFASSKHVFANPFIPEICPVLALALYIFSCSFIASTESRGSKLFDGTNPEASFNRWLHSKPLRDIPEEDLGMKPENIGSHSFRKGAATHVSSFDVVTETNVNFRAGWNQGRVRSRYIFGTPGADQLIGRILAGLNIHDCLEFLCIPPHFHEDTLNCSEWQQILVDFQGYPVGFKHCLHYLLATLCYHRQWLQDNCHPRHPIFNSRAWNVGILVRLEDYVIIEKKNCSCGILATGVPTLWAAIGIFDKIDLKLTQTNNAVKDYHEEIKVVTSQLPTKVCEVLQENYSIQGIAPITVLQMRNAMREQADMLLEEIRRNASSNGVHVEVEITNSSDAINTYPTWLWGGRFRFIPEGFCFPYCTTKALWDYWFFGTEQPQKIRPYRLIPRNDLSVKDKNKQKKAKMLIGVLLRLLNCTSEVMASKDYSSSLEGFERSFSLLINELMECRRELDEQQRARTSRFSQLQWISILNEAVKYRITSSSNK